MSALLLDIGNSRVKWGVADDGTVQKTGHVSQEKIREGGLAVFATKLPRRVESVIASNVAGASFATRISALLGVHCHTDVHFARSERRGWGVTNGYRQPRRLGVDRWVALVGAWSELQSACLVVDAGTALTLDALDDDGMHLGGQIIPGAQTMLNSLSCATSDLPLVKLSAKSRASELGMFGLNTTAAIREGVQNAEVGAIERAILALQNNGSDPTIVLTGGGSSRILEALDDTPLHRPNLVLSGLLHMLENEK